MAICELELGQYEKAMEATDKAYIALDAAIANVERAGYALAAAITAAGVCLGGFLAGPQAAPGVILCEIAAAIAIAAAENWVESAFRALELAQLAYDHAVDTESLAYDAFEECCRKTNAGSPPNEGDTYLYEADLVEVYAEIDEAEAAIEDSESEGEEVEDLVGEAEDAGDDLEDAEAVEESDEDLIA